MSLRSETSPSVPPSDAALAAAIATRADGIGLIANGRLVLANDALLALVGGPPSRDLVDPGPGTALGALVRWTRREPSGELSTTRLALGATLADASTLPLPLGTFEARAVFASRVADTRAPSVNAFERFLTELAPERAPSRDLLRDLVAFTPSIEESREALDVGAVFHGVLAAARQQLGGGEAMVARHGATARVLAHEARLAHLFYNLVLNAAAAAAPELARVVVATRSEADRVIVEVSADEVGSVDSAVESTLRRGSTTTQGARFRLAACRHIVKTLGGELVTQARLAEGFATVVLPRAAERRASSVPPSPPAARILIIDDEPLLGQTLKFAFSKRHDVVVALSGREALRLLDGDPHYDLVLCDLMMPDVPGQRVFEAVADRHPELLPHFYFMTGGAFTEGAYEFLEQHPERRIDKPFTIADIESLLKDSR